MSCSSSQHKSKENLLVYLHATRLGVSTIATYHWRLKISPLLTSYLVKEVLELGAWASLSHLCWLPKIPVVFYALRSHTEIPRFWAHTILQEGYCYTCKLNSYVLFSWITELSLSWQGHHWICNCALLMWWQQWHCQCQKAWPYIWLRCRKAGRLSMQDAMSDCGLIQDQGAVSFSLSFLSTSSVIW